MRHFDPILIFISLLMILFFVSTITVLSSYGLPPKEAEFKMPRITDAQKYAMSDTEYDE